MISNFELSTSDSTCSPSDFPSSRPAFPRKSGKIPKSRKKCKRALKRCLRERDELLQQIAILFRENEILRDVIRMSTAATRRQLNAQIAQAGLALSAPKKRRNSSRGR